MYVHVVLVEVLDLVVVRGVPGRQRHLPAERLPQELWRRFAVLAVADAQDATGLEWIGYNVTANQWPAAKTLSSWKGPRVWPPAIVVWRDKMH